MADKRKDLYIRKDEREIGTQISLCDERRAARPSGAMLFAEIWGTQVVQL